MGKKYNFDMSSVDKESLTGFTIVYRDINHNNPDINPLTADFIRNVKTLNEVSEHLDLLLPKHDHVFVIAESDNPVSIFSHAHDTAFPEESTKKTNKIFL